MISNIRLISTKKTFDAVCNKMNDFCRNSNLVKVISNKSEKYWKDELLYESEIKIKIKGTYSVDLCRQILESMFACKITEINETEYDCEFCHYANIDELIGDNNIFVVAYVPKEKRH